MVLFSFYFIVSATLLVQSFHSATFKNENPLEGYQGSAFPQSKDSVRQFVSNKNDVFNKDLFIKNTFQMKPTNVRKVLTKLLQDLIAPTKEEKRAVPFGLRLERKSKTSSKRAQKNPEWDKWTEWASCSVTCGKGRKIRWRRCLHYCKGVETEMKEKICQLPACGGKLFGLIKV